jgi:hypothetical protein
MAVNGPAHPTDRAKVLLHSTIVAASTSLASPKISSARRAPANRPVPGGAGNVHSARRPDGCTTFRFPWKRGVGSITAPTDLIDTRAGIPCLGSAGGRSVRGARAPASRRDYQITFTP